MSAAAALGASFLAVLAHPRWWVMALATFLVRGGLLLLLLPLIPLPTTAALANALGPTLVGFVFGGPSASFLLLGGTVVLALLAWFVAAGFLGAILDRALMREAAGEDELEGRWSPMDAGIGRELAVRWLAHVPTGAALAWGAAAFVDATYTELIQPGDPAIPVAVRVILRVPISIGLIVAAWAFGEAVGGVAVRRAASGVGIRRALLDGITGLLRPSGLLVFLVTSLGLIVAVGAGSYAIDFAFEQARMLILGDASTLQQALAVGLLSATWIGTIVLVAIAAAWRATAWTFEVARRQPYRTIGPLSG
ncbi:MAG: hypothetical protein HYX54_09375 [Chloroflexi bacterium]|nr:hypothetical protein [Chloroflexota bacterium]